MSETTVVNNEHQPLTDEQVAQQAKDMQMAQALMKHSQMELDKVTRKNNMQFHLFGAALNGYVSMYGTTSGFDYEQVWGDMSGLVNHIYDEQQAELELGSTRAQELAEKEIEEGVH